MALTHRGEEPDCGSRVGKLKGNKQRWNRAFPQDGARSCSGICADMRGALRRIS
jgi:hypothetical protein